jgi:predicted membrane protein
MISKNQLFMVRVILSIFLVLVLSDDTVRYVAKVFVLMLWVVCMVYVYGLGKK